MAEGHVTTAEQIEINKERFTESMKDKYLKFALKKQNLADAMPPTPPPTPSAEHTELIGAWEVERARLDEKLDPYTELRPNTNDLRRLNDFEDALTAALERSEAEGSFHLPYAYADIIYELGSYYRPQVEWYIFELPKLEGKEVDTQAEKLARVWRDDAIRVTAAGAF